MILIPQCFPQSFPQYSQVQNYRPPSSYREEALTDKVNSGMEILYNVARKETPVNSKAVRGIDLEKTAIDMTALLITKMQPTARLETRGLCIHPNYPFLGMFFVLFLYIFESLGASPDALVYNWPDEGDQIYVELKCPGDNMFFEPDFQCTKEQHENKESFIPTCYFDQVQLGIVGLFCFFSTLLLFCFLFLIILFLQASRARV